MISYFRTDLRPTVSHLSYPIKEFRGIDAASDENHLALAWASYGYNVTVKGGVLTGGMGLQHARINGRLLPDALSVGSRPIKLALYHRYDTAAQRRDDMLVGIMQNKRLYYARLTETGFTESELTFENYDLKFLNYHYDGVDYMLIIASEGKIYIFDGTSFRRIVNAPVLSDACVHDGRVYGTTADGTRLYYSEELDPTHWNSSFEQGGYIDFTDEGGRVKGVLSLKSALYVFRDYSINRLVRNADGTLSVSKIFSTHSLIYANSAAVCNDFLVFLTEDGFYKHDGAHCSRILWEITPMIADKSHATACFFDNKYYVALGIERDDEVVGDEDYELINNGIIAYDFGGGVSVFRGADVGCFLPISTDGVNMLCVVFAYVYRGFSVAQVDNSGRLFSKPLLKKYRSPVNELNQYDRDKVLRRVYIGVDNDITFTAKLDDERYSVDLSGSSNSQRITFNKSGERLGYELTTSADNFRVRGLLLELDFVRRRRID